MAGTTSKRSRAASIQKQAIDQVNVSLQELPEKPKDNLSLREAVSQLQDEIRAALAKGYSYDDLALMFSQKGIDISALTLKRYVSSGRSRAGKAKTPATRTRRPRQAKSTATSDTSSAAEPTETAKPGRRGSGTAAAKTRSTKATTAEPKKTNGRSSSRASKATSTPASKPASTRSRKRTTK